MTRGAPMSKCTDSMPSYSRGGWVLKFSNAVTHISVTHRKFLEKGWCLEMITNISYSIVSK